MVDVTVEAAQRIGGGADGEVHRGELALGVRFNHICVTISLLSFGCARGKSSSTLDSCSLAQTLGFSVIPTKRSAEGSRIVACNVFFIVPARDPSLRSG